MLARHVRLEGIVVGKHAPAEGTGMRLGTSVLGICACRNHSINYTLLVRYCYILYNVMA
jgi:hypothetical protein